MNKSTFILLSALAASTVPTLALADGLSYNIGAVSDYRYRGISQTNLKPALQGGADYARATFYAGTWLSTIHWVEDAGKPSKLDSGDAPVEWDLYLGSKGDLAPGLTYDLGTLAYVYVGQKFHNIGLPNPNTGEFYGALGWGPLTGKISISATNLFGIPDSKRSTYYELGGTFNLGQGFSALPHVGYQQVRHNSDFSYADYSLTVAKDFSRGLTGSLGVVATDADRNLYTGPSKQFTGRTRAVVGVKYAF